MRPLAQRESRQVPLEHGVQHFWGRCNSVYQERVNRHAAIPVPALSIGDGADRSSRRTQPAGRTAAGYAVGPKPSAGASRRPGCRQVGGDGVGGRASSRLSRPQRHRCRVRDGGARLSDWAVPAFAQTLPEPTCSMANGYAGSGAARTHEHNCASHSACSTRWE